MSEVEYWLFLFVYIIFFSGFNMNPSWWSANYLITLNVEPLSPFPPLPVVPVPLFYTCCCLFLFTSFSPSLISSTFYFFFLIPTLPTFLLLPSTLLFSSLPLSRFPLLPLLLSNSSPHLHSFTINSLFLLSPSLSRFPLLPSLFSWSTSFRPSWQQFPQFKARHPLHYTWPSLRVPQCCTI